MCFYYEKLYKMNNAAVNNIEEPARQIREVRVPPMDAFALLQNPKYHAGELDHIWSDIKLTIGRLVAVFSICVFLPALMIVTATIFTILGYIFAKIY